MQMDTRIPLMGTAANPLQSYTQGVSARDAVDEMTRNNRLQEFLQTNGQALAAGDQNALQEYASYDLQGAMGLQQHFEAQRQAQAAAASRGRAAAGQAEQEALQRAFEVMEVAHGQGEEAFNAALDQYGYRDEAEQYGINFENFGQTATVARAHLGFEQPAAPEANYELPDGYMLADPNNPGAGVVPIPGLAPEAPDATANMREFEMLAEINGYAPGTPAYSQLAMQVMGGSSSPSTVINMGQDSTQYPTPPAGQVYARGPDGELLLEQDSATGAMVPRLVNIRGSEAEMRAQEAAAEAARAGARQEGRDETAENAADTVVTFIDDALEILDNSNFATGLVGQLTSGFGASPAGRLESALKTIRANIGFETLAEMKENSPTGGALGQVAVQELTYLQSVEGMLEASMPEDDLRRNLGRIRESRIAMLNVIESDRYRQANNVPESFISRPEIIQQIREGVPLQQLWEGAQQSGAPVRPGTQPGQQAPVAMPADFPDPALWQYLSPEQRLLWAN